MASIPRVKPSTGSPETVRPIGTSPARPTYCLFCYDISYEDNADQMFVGHVGLDFEAKVGPNGKTRPNILTDGSNHDAVKKMEDGVKDRLKGTDKVRIPKPQSDKPEKVIVYKALDQPTKSVQLCFMVEPTAGAGEPCPTPGDVLISLEKMPVDGDPTVKPGDKRDSRGRLKPEYDPKTPDNWRPMRWRDGTLAPGEKDRSEDDKYDHRRRMKGPKFRTA